MAKFRVVLISLMVASFVAMAYLVAVHGASLFVPYRGWDAGYSLKWANGLLVVSVLLVLTGALTLYFTFFEIKRDGNGRLMFNNPENIVLRIALKDKLKKPISSCSVFWNNAICSLFALAFILMPFYFISTLTYIRHHGLGLDSLCGLILPIWVIAQISNDISRVLGRPHKTSAVLSWLNKIWLGFVTIMTIAAVIKEPVVMLYMLLIFIGMGAIAFISIWLNKKSSSNSIFNLNQEGHCPVIYPPENDQKELV